MVVMNRRPSRPARKPRLTAGLTLAAFALLLAPPPAASGEHDCPPPAPASVGVAPAPGHCHHVQAGPCADMLGCLATPVAVLTAPALVELTRAVFVTVTVGPEAVRGLLALGPPTPPPNS